MRVLIIEAKIQPDRVEDYIDAVTRAMREDFADEPGRIQFDVLRDVKDPNLVTLYEVWEDDDALAAHRELAATKSLLATIRPLMESGSLRSNDRALHLTW